MALKITKNLSVKWRLALFIIFLLSLLMAAGLGGLNGMRAANDSLSEVYNHEVLPLRDLRELDNLVQFDIVLQVEKVLFEQTTWDEGLKHIQEAKGTFDQKWSTLLANSEKSYSGSAWMDPAKPLISKSNDVINKIISLLKNRDEAGIDPYTDETIYPLADEFKATINTLILDRLAAVKSEYEFAQERYGNSKKAFTFTIIIGLLSSLVLSYLLIKTIDKPLSKLTLAMKNIMTGDLSQHLSYGRYDEFGMVIHGFNQMSSYLRELVGQVQRSGIQVTSSITELAATNKQQEVTATEHAATSSEIAASTNQIVATGANLMVTMKRVNSLTKNAAYAAEEGHSGLVRIDATLVKMENATESIVQKLAVLNEKAGNIAGVIKTINKIADQTNLLSLNAAIEAEKAGEYGSGFAVVATEIRRLADQTAVATFDIEQMVKEVQSAISTSVMGIDKFAEDAGHSVSDVRDISEQLQGVIEQVQVLRPQVESLTEGISAQTQGANQISEAINQLNDAAQQTAESLSQTSSSIAQLHQAAMGLQEGISRFKIEDSNKDNKISWDNHADSSV